jgi:hypothetical protein
VRRAGVGNGQRRGRKGHQPDRQIDPEDRPPAHEFDQHAAYQRTESDADTRNATPDADGASTFARFGEDIGDDRHRHRIEHRAADRLHHAKGDKPPDRRCEAAQQRSTDEDREPGLEDAAAADTVCGRARQQQETREHDHIGVDGPLQSRDRNAEVLADRRQGDVDDRGVHADDQQAHTADTEHQKLPATAHIGDGSRRGLMDQLSGLICLLELTFLSGA